MADKPSPVRRSREILGITGLALALFFLLSLVSYHPEDPSFTHFVPGNQAVHNLVGSFGSHMADALIRLIGISALLIPVLILVVSVRCCLRPDFRLGPAGVVGAIGLLLSTSGLAGALLADIPLHGIRLPAGGFLGRVLAELVRDRLNPAGTYLFFLLMLVVSLILAMDVSLIRLAQRGQTRAGAAWQKGKNLARRLLFHPRKHRDRDKRDRGPFIDAPASRPEPVLRRKPEQIDLEFARPRGVFLLPSLILLDPPKQRDTKVRREALIANSRILENKLADFGVEGKVVEVRPGPVIALYELEPAAGVKINRITNLSDDLALALKAPSIRIMAPIPGKAVIGIEIPNPEREPVYLRDVLDHPAFLDSPSKLPIALGVDTVGTPVIADLIRMPHLLIAGTTGSGKSVALNAMICSILFKAPADEVKFLLIDPKRLELSAYEGIPHLLHPVVVDPKKAAQVLRWAVEEMERRYEVIGRTGAKGIDSYNSILRKATKEGKTAGAGVRGKASAVSPRREPAAPANTYPAVSAEPSPAASAESPLPYIVIVIDELADLMMVAQRHVEESLARLAQMARASGIHLMIATQRPSVDVITGVIKANFPTRISFQVSSKVDSRTILDQLGAERLLGAGDMLFIPPGTSRLTRIHGAFVSDQEIGRIVEFLRKQGQPAFDESILTYEEGLAEEKTADQEVDEKYDEAVELVTELGQASISLVQRYLKVGYNRAARMIERMEAEGVVGPSDGIKPRKVLARKLSK